MSDLLSILGWSIIIGGVVVVPICAFRAMMYCWPWEYEEDRHD